MNKVILIGRTTKDIELKFTNNNTPVAQFTLAVNRKYSSENEADFINCVAWKQTAELINKYVKKGNLIGVEGRIQVRNYDDANGQKKYVTEVICDSVTFLQTKDTTKVENLDELGF